ncbi:MAG: DUF3727 domain-containing protein [Pseudanabaenaceae cyanobacterium bins.68]|nr:DUF3727 domain-containing protein [Pseudanabaenaceae cyanobacterium bins.68]
MDESTIVLTDETGKSLPCYLEKRLPLNGKEYILLNPIDYPVQIFAWESEEDEETGTLADVEEDEIATIFETAQAVLAEMNLVLKRTAYTLTVEGELPEVDEEDIIQIDGDDEEEGEEYVEIAHFYHEEREYSVFAEVDPLPYFAKQSHAGSVELLSPDELEEIQPFLEEQLAEDDDEEY